MNIAIFDFDDTICKGQSISGFIKYLLQKSGLRYRIEYYFRKIIMPYESNQYPQYKEFLLKTFTNLDEDFFESCSKEYAKILINQRMNKNVLLEVENHLKNKDYLILSSGGLEIYLKYIAKELNFDTLFATKLEFENQKFTGKIQGKENLDEQKVINFSHHFKNYNKLEVYTDSVNDLPLIEIGTKVNIIVNGTADTKWIKKEWRIIKV